MMSALSRMYVGDKYPPSWMNYEGEETAIYESNYLVPMFWFSMFCEENLAFMEDTDDEEGGGFLYLMRVKEKCIKAFEERVGFLNSLSPKAAEYLAELKTEIIETPGKYVSVDITEPFSMDNPEFFVKEVKFIMKSFDTNSNEHLQQLLKMACVKDYNPELADYSADEQYDHKYHAIGVKC